MTPIYDGPHPRFSDMQGESRQRVFRFPNGYGASVISGPYAHGGDEGLCELAVLKFDGDNYAIHYDNEIADGDVVGYLTEDKVTELLTRIAAFEAAQEGDK